MTDASPEALAEQWLPCILRHDEHVFAGENTIHPRSCPAHYRPIVAEGIRADRATASSEIAALKLEIDRLRKPVLPKLTRRMIEAACKAHYGSDNIVGIDLTVHGVNHSFQAGFRRMWKGVRAALTQEQSDG